MIKSLVFVRIISNSFKGAALKGRPKVAKIIVIKPNLHPISAMTGASSGLSRNPINDK